MSAHRNAMLGKIHVAKRDLGLDEDTYRDFLELHTGKRSSKDMSEAELARVIEAMRQKGFKEPEQPKRAGSKKLAPGDAPAKARALWLTLHNLAEVQDRAEAALHAFALNTAQVDAVKWLTARHWSMVIEALKAWAARIGFEVPPTEGDAGHQARQALLRFQWRLLASKGVVKIADDLALENWCWPIAGRTCSLEHMTPKQLDDASDKLGRWIRASKSRGWK